MSDSFATLRIVACQAPLFMGFPRQEYWSGLPFPPPGVLPDPGIKPTFPMSPVLQVDSLSTKPSGKPICKTPRRSNQSILKEISPEYSMEGLMLKLKLQYFGHLIWRADSLERPWFWERLKAGGEGNGRGWDGWMISLILWAWVWVHGVAKSQTCLSDWTTTMLNLPTRINSMFSVCENLFVSQRCCRFYFI